jgi:hypothetical protein
MMRLFAYFLLGLGIALMISALFGCTALTQMSDSWCSEHPHAGPSRCWGQPAPQPKSMSWDQENLKAGDSREACIARHGEMLEIDGLYVECY